VLCLMRCFDLVAFAPLCRFHLHIMRAVRGEHPVKAGEVKLGFGTKAASEIRAFRLSFKV
jgi:hypothetical protein